MKSWIKNSLRLLLSFMLAAPVSQAQKLGAESCTLLVSQHMGDSSAIESKSIDERVLAKVSYWSFGKKEIKEENQILTDSVGHLKEGELALGFNGDGSLRIYFGRKEATMLPRGNNSFEAVIEDHMLNLQNHDAVVIFKRPSDEMKRQMRALFQQPGVSEKLVSAYNCTALSCELLNLSTTPFDLRVSHPDQLFYALMVLKRQYYYYNSEVYISQRVKTPRMFYRTLKNLRERDEYSGIDDFVRTSRDVLVGTGLIVGSVSIIFLIGYVLATAL